MNLTHHAEYLTPGIFFPESTFRILPERSVDEALKAAPDSAFCFILFDLPVETDDAPEGFKLTPQRQSESARFYIDAEAYSLAEVEAMGEDKRTLASNMRGNNWATILKCRAGNWQPLLEGDVVLSTAYRSIS